MILVHILRSRVKTNLKNIDAEISCIVRNPFIRRKQKKTSMILLVSLRQGFYRNPVSFIVSLFIRKKPKFYNKI